MKKQSFAVLLVFVLAIVWPAARPAYAGHQFLWWDETGDQAFARFGANATIEINTGQIEFLSACPSEGVPDAFYPFADIYIVPSGSVAPGDDLEDVSGEPNTVAATTSGLFVNELIGRTLPSGTIGEGTYAVVYDECQDGKLTPADAIFDPAFEVLPIPTNVPSLPSCDPPSLSNSICVIKTAAGEAKQKLEDLHDWLKKYFAAATAADIGNPLSHVLYGMGLRVPLTDPRAIALIHVANAAKRYAGIAADPPDPHFQQLTALEARDVLDPQSNDPVIVATAGMGTALSNEAALAEALLHSLERYQGADAAANGRWALIHARAIQHYTQRLATQLGDSSAAHAGLHAAISADTTPVDANAAALQAFVSRVRTSGFTAEELQAARYLGLTDAGIAQLRTDLSALDFSTFSKANLLTTLANLQTNTTSLAAELNILASDMGAIITTLEADAAVMDMAPIAHAGGPYSGNAGTAITFDAAGSTSPSSITNYAWDLDGDGAFDDATGPTASFTYNQAFKGMVGVQITNADNLSNIGYAAIDVANVNSRPSITAFTPTGQGITMVVGDAQTFSVSASAPAGHALSTQWFVDRQPAAGGDQFSYTPTPAEVGVHSVVAVVSDTSAGGRAVQLQWIVGVLTAAVRTDPPTILPTIAPHPNGGWNNTDVTVTWSVIDLYSGVASSNGCATTALTAETAGATLTCSATSGTGLSDSRSVTVRIDKTPPTTTATPSRPVNGAITVALAAADSPGGSGVQEIRYFLKGAQTGAGVVAGSAGSVTISAQGTSYLVYSAADVAGNREAPKVLTINNQTAAADYVVADGFAVSLFATGFPNASNTGPIGVAFDSANQLFVSDYIVGDIYKFGPAGGVASPATRVADLSGATAGLAFDKDGRLYVARQNARDVLEINLTTGSYRTAASGIPCATALATDPLSGDLFASTVGCTSVGVYRISNFKNGLGTLTPYASLSVDGLTFAPDGTLYGAGGGTVYRIAGTNTATPGAATVLASGILGADGVAVAASSDPSRPPFVFVNRTNGIITKVDLTTSPPTLTNIVSNGTRGDFVAVGPDGCLYATQTATILKVTNADGTCNLAPIDPAPQLQLAPQAAARAVGTSHSVTASLRNVSAPAGIAVTFTVSGAHNQSATVTSDASGQATFSYTGSIEGLDQVVATASATGKSVTSNPARVIWVPAAPDTTPPTTTTTAAPAANAFGWNNTDVAVQLTAVDNPGGAGVKEIHYTLAGVQSTNTIVAGSSAVAPVTAEGVTILTYFAIDNVGNQEPPQSLTIRIDKTSPASTAIRLPNATTAGWNNTDVTVRVGAADNPGGSGVRDIQSTLSGAQTGGTTVTGSFAPVTVSDEGITTVAYAATDRAGNQAAVGNVTVRIDTSAPTTTMAVVPAANAAEWNNTDVLVSLSAQDSPGGSGVQQISYTVGGAQTGAGVVAGPSGSVTISTPGLTTITAFATDNAGNAGPMQTRTVHIDKTPPTVSARPMPLPDATGRHTTPVTVSLRGVDVGGSGVKELTYTLSGAQTGDSVVVGSYLSVTISAVGITTISAVATDNAGNTGPASVTVVTIIPPDPAPPRTTNVVATPNPAAVNTLVGLTATVSDVETGGSNIASAEYSLDGGAFIAMDAQDAAFDSPTEVVTANIGAFPVAGVYSLCVRGMDVPGNLGSPQCVLLAVYDPSTGFVTGGGWINSPAGACQLSPVCEGAVGRANFGFVAKYQKGATIPTGQTEFQVGNLNFHSESYQWLVVAGAKAQYKGTGRVNGTPGYGFLLTATDGQVSSGGGVDKFRIKISDANGNIVYDNVMGASDDINTANPQAISGGNIIIHK